MSNAGAAPTGCFKCGRPGHWSRDCPSSAPDSNNSNPNTNLNPNPNPNPTSNSTHNSTKSGGGKESSEKAAEKPKKAPRTRPKLTAEKLLSDEGLGYVLRHFPGAFKCRGRGHEVSDLGNLIGMYEEWHSRLLPSYSFEQFVHKVDQIGASKRVKMTLRDLREKVATGGDLTKLHELSSYQEGNHEQEAKDSEEPSHNLEDAVFPSQDDIIQEDMLHDVYEKTNEDPSQSRTSGNPPQSELDASSKGTAAGKAQEPNQENSSLAPSAGTRNEMTEEQKARIEANRLKALEKAAARRAAAAAAAAHSLPSQ